MCWLGVQPECNLLECIFLCRLYKNLKKMTRMTSSNKKLLFIFISMLPNVNIRLIVIFEAISCQVTTTFDALYTMSIPSVQEISYTGHW